MRPILVMALWFVVVTCALGAAVGVMEADPSAIVFGVIAFACWAGIERLTDPAP